MKENHSSSEHEHSSDNHHSHEDHHDHSHHVADYWKRFIISLIISIPVLVLSPMIQEWLGFELTFSGDRYVLAILADRKSTRLNSSHVAISYAVFCLKKKRR